jgi:UMP-CMP kinase
MHVQNRQSIIRNDVLQGAGKGTQCELLKQNYPCVHLSAGQLLRDEALKKDTSEHAALIEECLVAGKIVPVEISLALLQNAMRDADGQSLLFLVDGFPRNFDNLEGWTRCMTQQGGQDPASVWGTLVYNCPLPTLEKRIMERSKDSGRSDDNLQSLRRRFTTFQGETIPVVNTMRLIEENSLLKVVDIKGEQTLEKVWEDTQKAMNNFLANDILSANVRLLEAISTKDVDTYRSLCADEMFDGESTTNTVVTDIMLAQEGLDNLFTTINVKCAELTFITGTKVSVRYDRTSDSGTTFRETRVWSHQGSKGWRMVHFSRSA